MNNHSVSTSCNHPNWCKIFCPSIFADPNLFSPLSAFNQASPVSGEANARSLPGCELPVQGLVSHVICNVKPTCFSKYWDINSSAWPCRDFEPGTQTSLSRCHGNKNNEKLYIYIYISL